MSALTVEALPPPQLSPTALLGRARSYGHLRAVTPHQAPVVRAAAEHDRSVLPRWQRGGDGIHVWCSPRDYAVGRTWVRRQHGPVPGATGDVTRERVEVHRGVPHVNWRSRDHWLEVIVPLAIEQGPESLRTRRGTVTAETFRHWARTVSLHCHQGSGRRCIVRVDRLAELMGVHKSTVQRCQLAAEALGLYVVVEPARMLTEAETLTARTRGSRQRGLANDAALVVPDWLARERVGELTSARGTHTNDTPTRGRYSNSSHLQLVSSLGEQKPRSARESEPPPAAQHRRRTVERPPSGSSGPHTVHQSGSGRVYDPQALELARCLTEAVPWLRGTAPGRLETGLRRFVRCALPWTPGDLIEAIDQANARLGRAAMTRDLVKNPPALLAKYLRDFDPDADHPRFWLDPTRDRDAGPSHMQRRNALLLQAHREGHGASRTPGVAQAAAAKIRDDLAARRAARDSETL